MRKSFSRCGGWHINDRTPYRSGLEDNIAAQLRDLGVDVLYEKGKISYQIPASDHVYTPDFILPNGIIVESKGIFDSDDRRKHLLIKKQHPLLDIRFVFSSLKTKIYSGSKTTVAMWCDKYGFKYAAKLIPEAWLKEPKRPLTGLVPVERSKNLLSTGKKEKKRST